MEIILCRFGRIGRIDEKKTMNRISVVLILLVLSSAQAWAGLEEDKGTRIFRKYAEQGDAWAQCNLGIMYEVGKGVPQDYAEAVRWYRKAADQGLADAQFNLGRMFIRGDGVPEDHARAFKLYRRAAEQGLARAQSALGSMYSDINNDPLMNEINSAILGRPIKNGSVPLDYVESVKWDRKAADQGYYSAQFSLGVAYDKGQGVPRDVAEAAWWFRKAAEQGFVIAQSRLGNMYKFGEGVPQSNTQAYFWYSLAADDGRDSSINNRDNIAKLITPAQIAEGQEMVQNWRLKTPQPIGFGYYGPQFAEIPKPESEPQHATTPKLAATPRPEPEIQSTTTAPQDIAGLQRQLKRIEGLIAKKDLSVTTPKTAAVPRFPSTPVSVSFPRSPPRPDDIAVIIGNADYGEGRDIPNVNPAYADAEGIKNYVTQALGISDENVIFLKDASQAELTATFGSKESPKGQLFNYVKPGKSRVFIYYSGHGAPGAENGGSYIVPSDAQASLIELNGYLLKTLYKNLSKIPAKSVTVVLEACFSGASQSGSVITQASPIYLKAKETGVPSNITVIAAGAANQIASWEQDSSSGLFTKYFLKGMSGEADTKPYGNGDGKVSYEELGRYFKETLTYFARRYYGREQTAQIVVGR